MPLVSSSSFVMKGEGITSELSHFLVVPWVAKCSHPLGLLFLGKTVFKWMIWLQWLVTKLMTCYWISCFSFTLKHTMKNLHPKLPSLSAAAVTTQPVVVESVSSALCWQIKCYKNVTSKLSLAAKKDILLSGPLIKAVVVLAGIPQKVIVSVEHSKALSSSLCCSF